MVLFFAMHTEEIINLKKINQALLAELNTYKKRCEQYAQAYEQLQHQVNELLRHRFGKKSEHFIDPEHPQQDMFLDAKKFASTD